MSNYQDQLMSDYEDRLDEETEHDNRIEWIMESNGCSVEIAELMIEHNFSADEAYQYNELH